MIKLNPQMTIDLLKLAVAERGVDYVAAKRDPSDPYSPCEYTSNGTDPSCIVGHVLHYVGLPMNHVVLSLNSSANETLDRLQWSNEMEIDDISIRLLCAAQSIQDGVYDRDPDHDCPVPQPWGKVVTHVLKEAEKLHGLKVDHDLHTNLTVAQVRELASA